MKKIVSIVFIFALMFTFIGMGNTFAVINDTLTLTTDKELVRPGQTVTLTANFGENLGAYTFNINYDRNIFTYESVEGGTANDVGGRVIVSFYDTNGGANPRQSMSITFRAKSDITTSNSTELTLTSDGLSNQAGVDLDDITVPKVKEVTVEPEYQDYVINLEYIGEIIKEQAKDMVLSYSSSMGRYYEQARLVGDAVTPTGAHVTLKGLNLDTNVEQDILENGWGDPQGYAIGGKDVLQKLNVKAVFTDAGDYTITLKLIDRKNSDTVIASKDFSFKVLDESSQIVPPAEEIPTIEEPTTSTEKPTKPITLPKTGTNLYVVMIVSLITVVCTMVYFNKKK